MTVYDTIIIGGGIAGLSLAHALVHSPLGERSILILERRSKTQNDRTLGFWTDRPTPFDGIVARSWDRLRIAGDGYDAVQRCGRYRYNVIRGIDFYTHIRAELAARPNVTWIDASVQDVIEGPTGAIVCAGGQRYAGRWVFDSRFKLATCRADSDAVTLEQHFVGWEIETPCDTFDPDVPTFMDFRVPQVGEVRFCYVLPYSRRRALVEFVLMTRDTTAENVLRRYVERTLGIMAYRVVAKEGGVSPLSTHRFPRRASAHVMRIGTAGGRIKPTSGYGFTRILADSQAIVRSLMQTGQPFDVPDTPPFYRLCDTMMLRVMAQRPDWLKPLFVALFRGNPLPRIFAFLDEATSPAQSFGIGLTLTPQIAQCFADAAGSILRPQPGTRVSQEMPQRTSWV